MALAHRWHAQHSTGVNLLVCAKLMTHGTGSDTEKHTLSHNILFDALVGSTTTERKELQRVPGLVRQLASMVCQADLLSSNVCSLCFHQL